MPPTRVHFNGGVNLGNTDAVMREIAARVPKGVSRIPDGETGDRQQWIFYQFQKFVQTPGVEQVRQADPEGGYQTLPEVRLASGVHPDDVEWPNLGYADVYQESYRTFVQLRDDGIIAPGVRFQAQYPTPLASINAWFSLEEQHRVEPSYQRALFADLGRLLDALPHDDIAVQWDVAVEFGILTGGFDEAPEGQGFDDLASRLARCADEVPADVPVGFHLCYGDYQHVHFREPESLELQVRMVNEVTSSAGRPVNWFSFTVPQYQRNPDYFAPLRDLRVGDETELYFALVPYHPEDQESGTTADQVQLIDSHLGDRSWGVCTECGMARAEQEDVPGLLNLHREILAGTRT